MESKELLKMLDDIETEVNHFNLLLIICILLKFWQLL